MPIHPRTPPEVIGEIRARYMAPDMPKVEAIAIDCGVSPAIVRKYTSDLPRRSAFYEARAVRVRELAAEGKDVGEIARELGCAIRFVVETLRSPPF